MQLALLLAWNRFHPRYFWDGSFFFIMVIQPFQSLRQFDEIVNLSGQSWHDQISVGYALSVWKVW